MNEKDIWDKTSNALYCYDELKLSPYTVGEIKRDFKHMLFTLSRYKFAGKLIDGRNSMLDLGCNDGFKTMLFNQFVNKVIGVDFDEDAIKFAQENYSAPDRKYICSDILSMGELEEKVDAIVSIDVIEHIHMEKESKFMDAIVANLQRGGICVIGTPNITASQYQAPSSTLGHINMYSHGRLKDLMGKYFENVFMFGMNDEVVHTGYPAMAHYLIALGVGVRTAEKIEEKGRD